MLQVVWLILLTDSCEWELSSDSNSCLQPDLKSFVWRSRHQTRTLKSPKWGSAPLTRVVLRGGKAPWHTLAMGMSPQDRQSHHIPARIWSVHYSGPCITATELPREGRLSEVAFSNNTEVATKTSFDKIQLFSSSLYRQGTRKKDKKKDNQQLSPLSHVKKGSRNLTLIIPFWWFVPFQL